MPTHEMGMNSALSHQRLNDSDIPEIRVKTAYNGQVLEPLTVIGFYIRVGVHHVHRPRHAVPPVNGWHEGPLWVCPWTGAHNQVGAPKVLTLVPRMCVWWTRHLVDMGRFGRLHAISSKKTYYKPKPIVPNLFGSTEGVHLGGWMKKGTPVLCSLRQSWMRPSGYMRLRYAVEFEFSGCWTPLQVHKEAELTVHVFPGLPPAPGQLCHGEDRLSYIV